MDGVLVTVRGTISTARGLVSLSDMWNLAGKDKQGNHPRVWAGEHNVALFDIDDQPFASEDVALAYAWHLSPTMAGTLEYQLKPAKSPFDHYSDDKLSATSDKSRALFVSALNKAGIHSDKHYSMLTNLLYQHTLNTSAKSLRKAYCHDDRFSVRKALDCASLAKVMTVEINVSSAIHSDQLSGYAEVAHKIKQHGDLVKAMYRNKVH
jgi:hypothetical protein